jgi:hypothetical protein
MMNELLSEYFGGERRSPPFRGKRKGAGSEFVVNATHSKSCLIQSAFRGISGPAQVQPDSTEFSFYNIFLLLLIAYI